MPRDIFLFIPVKSICVRMCACVFLSQASKPAPMEPEPKPTAVASKATPYQAAYSENRAKTTDQWYCDLCEKKFNGPQPLRSHMASRYHKDMVEELEDSKR